MLAVSKMTIKKIIKKAAKNKSVTEEYYLQLYKTYYARSRVEKENLWSDMYQFNGPITVNGVTKQVEGKKIQAFIKSHLMTTQRQRCCYCKRYLVSSGHARHVEHVLPGSVYPQYVFMLRNLAVSCVECNLLKTKDVWWALASTSLKYPIPDKLRTCFHPNIDTYDSEIRFVRISTNHFSFSCYYGLTDKGRHLCKELLSKVSHKELILANDTVMNDAITKVANFSAGFTASSETEKFLMGIYDYLARR